VQIRDTIPFVLVICLGPLRDACLAVVSALRRGGRSMLLIVNGLNLADAALTAAAIRSGEGTEANPFVRWMGLPAKVLLVAFASVLIARYRPRLLVWPAVVLVGVLAWHISGLVLNGGL
jgi:hypothetical protein